MVDENNNTENPEVGTVGDQISAEELSQGLLSESEVPVGKRSIFRTSEELDLDTVLDIPVEVVVVLGQTKMSISDLLALGSGSIVELQRTVGEPVEIYVGDRLIARGEVVIVEDHIGVTLTEIIKVDRNKDAQS